MTDNEQRAHDLALTAVQAIFNKGNIEDDYELLENHSSDENIFSSYQSFYREFLWRLNH